MSEQPRSSALESSWPTAAGRLLLQRCSTEPTARILAVIAGPGGTGKSTLLARAGAALAAAGVRVRYGDDVTDTADDASCVWLIDDAHELDEPALNRIRSLVDEGSAGVILAYRPAPRSAALARLVKRLEVDRLRVVLGPYAHRELTDLIDASLGRPVPIERVDEILESTGGLPWLVHRAIETIGPLEDAGTGTMLPLLGNDVLHELDRQREVGGPELDDLLLGLAVGFDLSGLAPSMIDPRQVDSIVAKGSAAGLLLPDGTLVPMLRTVIIESTPTHRLRAMQRDLLETSVAGAGHFQDIARSLARTGMRDPRIASALEQAADELLASEPARASDLYAEAIAAGGDQLATAARRAQAAAAVGDLDGAGRIVDDLLTHEEAPDEVRAVDTLAAIWAQRGMLGRSAELYGWLGPLRIGTSAPMAALALLGVGDREGAERALEQDPARLSPSLLTTAIAMMGQGLMDSVADGSETGALPALVRSSDTMTASGVTLLLPDFPAVLAAIVAIHGGQLDVATSVLDDALSGGQCGAVARRRLLLMSAWTAMLADRTDDARDAIALATAEGGKLAARDGFLMAALEVGLARRLDDGPGLVRAWQQAREAILHVPADLYSLLPLGELVVAGARMRESARLQSHLADAWALLGRLGHPPLWSLMLHWSCVRAAILSDRPKDLAPHAEALMSASGGNRLAAVLAHAARAWVAMLSGASEVATVEAAARGLASVGLSWDGARLAGHAAGRAKERPDMIRLLALAREVRPARPANGGDQSPPAPARDRVHDGGDHTSLSAREREVARLVLQGRTYREIGETIFVSPRTAEHHIARIRRRLGATTRSELLTRLRAELDEPPERREGPDALHQDP